MGSGVATTASLAAVLMSVCGRNPGALSVGGREFLISLTATLVRDLLPCPLHAGGLDGVEVVLGLE